MNEPELWMLAINAFAAVLLLLSLLAGAIWLLTALAPARPGPGPGPEPASPEPALAAAVSGTGDAATVAAIHAAVQRTLPGGRVVRIEEVP